MRKLSLLVAFAVLLPAGGAAFAKEKAKGDAPRERKICKSVKTTSSRIAAKRICKTEAEWAQASSQEELDDAAGRLRGATRGN